jgi:hypothetical protein
MQHMGALQGRVEFMDQTPVASYHAWALYYQCTQAIFSRDDPDVNKDKSP